ncbi:MAG TPA: hypothetical protein VGD35_23125 [Chitinophaga sp.]
MEKLFSATLIFHIAGGTLSLLSGLLAIVTRKGGRLHRAGGKVFFAAMTLVFVTALIMAVIKELTFLLMVAFFSYHMLLRGYRALYLKRQHQGVKLALPDILINGVGIIFNTGLLIWGISHLLSGGNYIHIVAVFFGLLGISMAGSDVKRLFIPPTDKKQWLYTHIGGMGGAYIAAVTAFMVVNVHFLPGLVVWTAPAVIGLGLISMAIRQYRKKEEKRAASSLQREITYI